MYDATALLPLAVGTFFVGEFNHQLVRLDFNPDDMRVDEDCILDLGGYVEDRRLAHIRTAICGNNKKPGGV